MSEAKFTKGPWEEFSMGIIGVYIEGRHSWTHIATNGEPYEGSLSEEESKANAHLIAAAPELYSALNDALSGLRYIRERYGSLSGVGFDRVDENGQAALAKARGETP